MKVYQCIHQYPPYTPYFEETLGSVLRNLSFEEMRRLVIADGYGSTYILKPAIEGRSAEVFYTIWDFAPLQLKWAAENGLKTRDLDEIKLAQIEAFQPDVFYNHSPRYDRGFVRKLQHRKAIIKVCWDSVVDSCPPPVHELYDLRFTLFEPFVKYWNQRGHAACLLPPAFDPSWDGLSGMCKEIDVLFYGQYRERVFSERDALLDDLSRWGGRKGLKLALHVQRSRSPLINLGRGLRRLTRLPVAPLSTARFARPPIYGRKLYETIARSKIVVNGFGNFNGLYKDNMRNYESIGCGAFLIGADGIYPEHFAPDEDFFTYRSAADLFGKIERVLAMPDQGAGMAQKTREKLRVIYSKENQWSSFLRAVNGLSAKHL
jgi:hypothetical protein